MSTPSPESSAGLARHLSAARLSTYLTARSGHLDDAVALYAWNSKITGALWEHLGHLETALRNTLDARLAARHHRARLPGSWLDDPAGELTPRAHQDIATARSRLRAKGKTASKDQAISELSFGSWRFLLSRTYSGRLWPDLASGFPHAPTRSLSTIETPVRDLHELRNRLAHHQRVYSQPLADRHRDKRTLLGYIDPTLAAWTATISRAPAVLAQPP